MMWGDYGGGWWVVMGLSMALFWGLVIVGAIWLVRLLRGRPGVASAHELLENRLSSGEIQVDEYRRLKQELPGGNETRRSPFTVLSIAGISVLVLIPYLWQ